MMDECHPTMHNIGKEQSEREKGLLRFSKWVGRLFPHTPFKLPNNKKKFVRQVSNKMNTDIHV